MCSTYASNIALVTPPSVIRLGPIPVVVNELIVVVFGGVLRGSEATARSPRGARA
jgi:hypothetical protein